MNKFEMLLSLLAKVQEDYIGTEIADMGGYSDYANCTLKLADGSRVKIEVTVTEPPKKEPINDEQN
jgi:hypothetical protein